MLDWTAQFLFCRKITKIKVTRISPNRAAAAAVAVAAAAALRPLQFILEQIVLMPSSHLLDWLRLRGLPFLYSEPVQEEQEQAQEEQEQAQPPRADSTKLAAGRGARRLSNSGLPKKP